MYTLEANRNSFSAPKMGYVVIFGRFRFRPKCVFIRVPVKNELLNFLHGNFPFCFISWQKFTVIQCWIYC